MISFFRLRIVWFCLLCVLAVALMIQARTEGDFLRRVIFSSGAIVRRVAGGSASALFTVARYVKTKNAILRENEALRDQIRSYQRELHSVSALEYEKAALRRMLQFSLSVPYELVPAQIIAVEGLGTEAQAALINRGAAHGITRRMAVAGVYQNELVALGTISEVSRYTAQFMPLTNGRFSVPAQTEQSLQRGIVSGSGARGKGQLLFISDAVNASDAVFVKERLVINENAVFFPKGMLVGEVSYVDSDSANFLFRAYVQPYLTVSEVDYVFVLVPKEDAPEEYSEKYSEQSSEQSAQQSAAPRHLYRLEDAAYQSPAVPSNDLTQVGAANETANKTANGPNEIVRDRTQ